MDKPRLLSLGRHNFNGGFCPTNAMTKEIERKYLVPGDFPQDATAVDFVQGYLLDGMRIRRESDGFHKPHYMLCLKQGMGIEREEYESQIHPMLGEHLLSKAEKLITKTRHYVWHEGKRWEVDVFNDGLVLAELELRSVDEEFTTPPWVGKEVTDDPNYSNINMAKRVNPNQDMVQQLIQNGWDPEAARAEVTQQLDPEL